MYKITLKKADNSITVKQVSSGITLKNVQNTIKLYHAGKGVKGDPGDSGVTTYAEFVYNSSGAQEGNRFNDWADLYAAAVTNGQDGPKRITFEQNETLPTGTYNLHYVLFRGTQSLAALDGGTVITLPDGFLVTDWHNGGLTDGIGLQYEGNSPLLSISDGFLAFNVDSGSIVSCVNAPLIALSGDALGITKLDLGATFYDGGSPIVDMADAAVYFVIMGGSNTIIADDSFSGNVTGGAINVVVINSSAGLQLTRSDAGLTGSIGYIILPRAGMTSYDSTDSGLAASDVQAAIDELALGGGGGGPVEAADVTFDDSSVSFATGGDVTGDDVQAVTDDLVDYFQNAVDTLEGSIASSKEQIERNINSIAHGLSVGDWVVEQGGSDSGLGPHYFLAQADSLANCAGAWVVSHVADADHFTICLGGNVAGLALTPSMIYYISPDTPGTITTTRPSAPGQIIKPVLYAVGTTRGYVDGGIQGQVVEAPSNVALTKNVELASHGFSLGDWVTHSYAAATYVLASAFDIGTANTAYLVTEIIDTDNFTITMEGYVGDRVDIFGGTVAQGTMYYLDEFTAGTMDGVPPVADTKVIKPIFYGSGPNSGYVFNVPGGEIIGVDHQIQYPDDDGDITLNFKDYIGAQLYSMSSATDISGIVDVIPPFKQFVINITSASSQTITFDPAVFRGSTSVPLPIVTTGGGVVDYLVFVWNNYDNIMDLVSKTFEVVDTDGTLAANSDTKVATQKAVKTYVDAVAQGLSVKGSVKLATAATLPTNTYLAGVITGTATGVLTIDGTAVALNDRILVKDEASALKNGVYTCTTAGAIGVAFVLTRSADMDSAAEFPGAFVFVETGTTNAAAGFVCTNSSNPTVGTTAINFTQFSGTGEITNGTGLLKSGNTLSVNLGVTVQGYDADLNTIAGLTATTDNFMQSKAGAWASRTPAQVKTDLGIVDNVMGMMDLTTSDYFLQNLYTTVTTLAVTSGRAYFFPIIVGKNLTVDRSSVLMTATSAPAGATLEMGLYTAVNGKPAALVDSYGTVAIDTGTLKEITISKTLAPGQYFGAILPVFASGAVTLRAVVSSIARLGSPTATDILGQNASGLIQSSLATLPNPAVPTAGTVITIPVFAYRKA